MASKLAEVLSKADIFYGDAFLVRDVQTGEYLGHEVIRISDDHPKTMFDFFCFYKNNHPIYGRPELNDTLQLYDINRTNICERTEITRKPVWEPNHLNENRVQDYLNAVEKGIVSGKYQVELVTTCRGGGLLAEIINLLGLIFGDKSKQDFGGEKIDV